MLGLEAQLFALLKKDVLYISNFMYVFPDDDL
jgi:hypothetical protein